MQMSKWRKCYRPESYLDDFAGCYCIYGIDLAAKTDIAAVVRMFWRMEDDDKVHFYLFPEFWLPSERLETSPNSQYKGWANEGLIQVSDGPVTDITEIQNYILNDAKRFQPLAIAYDPWQATQMAQNLLGEGLPMTEISQSVKNMSEPMKQLQALTYEKRIHTDGNPVLTWMASNVVCHLDAKDNVYPRKETPDNKIDGIVAAIMCVNRAIALDVETNYVGDETDFSNLVI